jgi:cholesterol oxidase
MNYLPDAVNHGAEIYTQVAVRRLEHADGRWVVHYEMIGSGREKFDAPQPFVTADVVVLGAGALGSTEILLRSRAAGLKSSNRLGERFTGNGDVLGFGYNTDAPIDGVGFGERRRDTPVGPCITGVIDARQEADPSAGMVIEEGSIPGGLAGVVPAAMAAAAVLAGHDTDTGVADLVRERERELKSLVRGPYHGAVRNTQTYLVMTHDDGAGRMHLDNDRLRIDWPA